MDSNPAHRIDAKRFTDEMGITLQIRDISSILRASKAYKALPLWMFPSRKIRARLVTYGREKLIRHNDENILLDRIVPQGNQWMTRGNSYGMAKHRTRMLVVYQYAEMRNLMVVGAANRTEWLTELFANGASITVPISCPSSICSDHSWRKLLSTFRYRTISATNLPIPTCIQPISIRQDPGRIRDCRSNFVEPG
jgi:hypothetical protein